MAIGAKKGSMMYVASPVCQKQRVSFDKLCEIMAEDSTVGQADIAAVFYKFRTVLNRLCSQGSIVDAGPLGSFRPTFTSKAVEKEEDFKPSTHITKTQVLFTPSPDFRTLHEWSSSKCLHSRKRRARRSLKVVGKSTHNC